MKKPLVVGITGGIGSGKTTVVEIFKKLNVPVYMADKKAKSLMQNDSNLIKRIKKSFGDQSYDINGNLNSTYLSNIVFNDSKKLANLNSIVHPAVRKDFQSWLSQQRAKYVLYESALIFEHEQQDKFDYIILVTAPREVRIKRVQKRDNCSANDVIKRMDNQMDEEIKIKKADIIIENIKYKELSQKIRNINYKILTKLY
ncbi:MAG: dephospho-CoA kinase [Psychroflexus sp.]|nr:dephospho-CoA kinase [Psychroflexus sp.]